MTGKITNGQHFLNGFVMRENFQPFTRNAIECFVKFKEIVGVLPIIYIHCPKNSYEN